MQFRLRLVRCWVLLMLIPMTCGVCAFTSKELGEQREFPPIELIEKNATETDVTIVVEITRVQQVETIGFYSNWEITAKVRKSLKGNLVTGETIQYGRSVEGNSLTLPIGSLHLVSFIWKEERLVIPDVGYHFPYSPTLRKHVEATFP